MVKFRLFLTLIALLALCTILSNPVSAAQGIAPDFTLNDINGKKVNLSEFKGKAVLLNFWAT